MLRAQLLEQFSLVVQRTGLAPEEILAAAQEVVVFGSYAAGCAGPDSDLDVLCVGCGPRLRTKLLDLLWVPRDKLENTEWLGSELANNVAAYGVWLKGNGDWVSNVFRSPEAIVRKRALISRRIEALGKYWQYLSNGSRSRTLKELDLDIRRLSYLERGEAVPPRPLLVGS